MIEPSVGRQQRWYRKPWVWGGAVVLAAALFLLLYGVSLLGPAAASNHRFQYIRVRQGETASDVGANLAGHGIIQSASLFDLLSRYNGVATHLTVGVYRLSASEPLGRIMRAMRDGNVVTIKVTIPEGLTVQQIAARLVAAHIGTKAQFLSLEKSPLRGMPRPAKGVRDPLEGYLYPATYQFSYGTSARQALIIMWRTFQARVVKGLYNHSNSKLSLVDWVTLASIVQQESQQAQQDAAVAAVFMNRYKAGMPFQSDATVKYALGGLPPGGLVPADLENPSPYNTYAHVGFPPGPICNPGLTTLKAALKPAPVSYFYFVSLRSGRLLFAKTFARQLANIQYAKNHPNA